MYLVLQMKAECQVNLVLYLFYHVFHFFAIYDEADKQCQPKVQHDLNMWFGNSVLWKKLFIYSAVSFVLPRFKLSITRPIQIGTILSCSLSVHYSISNLSIQESMLSCARHSNQFLI